MRYREQKATQAAARLIKYAGGEINHMKLIKLLYLADRHAIITWGRPITFDSYVSMPHGPVLSFTLDLINFPGRGSYWGKYISAREAHEVRLKGRVPHDQLSPAEEELLDTIWSEFGKMTQWNLVDYTHELPEWRDPNGSSTPIHIEDILQCEGFTADDVRDVTDALEAEEFAATLDA